MKKKISLLFLMGLMLFSCSGAGDNATLFVEAIANHPNLVGVTLYTELTNSFINAIPLKTTDFYITITTIKLKTRGREFVTIKDDPNSSEEELVRGANIVNGITIPASDYNLILIGYKANWWIKATNTNNTSFCITNSTNATIKYCILYNDASTLQEVIQSDPSYENASSFYIISSISFFAGDNKWIYLYFDTENIARTDENGEQFYLIPPTLNMELK